MSGKIKIVRVLGNPKPRKKKKKAKRRAGLRSRKRLRELAKGNSRYLIRLIAPRGSGYYQAWWTGKTFKAQKNSAKRFIGEGAAATALRAATKAAPAGAVAVEAIRT